MAPFERVDYSLRPNKNVERKLMLAVLQALELEFPIGSYRYIGMGSMWFVDFVLFHKYLGINDMFSIERASVDRARFNKPYACIKVVEGESTIVLRRLALSAKRAVVWLDHESDISGPAFDDLAILCEELPANSIIVITVNAGRSCLDGAKSPTGIPLDKETALREIAKDLVPTPLSGDALEVKRFPTLVSELLFNQAESSLLKAGRSETFQPLFNCLYRDGATMVTIGGMLLQDSDREKIARCRQSASEFMTLVRGEQYEIKVPRLTLKEKAALDQLFPSDKPMGVAQVRQELKLTFKADELRAYQKFYKEYPIFGEFIF